MEKIHIVPLKEWMAWDTNLKVALHNIPLRWHLDPQNAIIVHFLHLLDFSSIWPMRIVPFAPLPIFFFLVATQTLVDRLLQQDHLPGHHASASAHQSRPQPHPVMPHRCYILVALALCSGPHPGTCLPMPPSAVYKNALARAMACKLLQREVEWGGLDASNMHRIFSPTFSLVLILKY